MTTPLGPAMPLDVAATHIAREAQARLGLVTPLRAPLTDVERREASDLFKQGAICQFCAALHVGASTPACPRLASGKLNGDGALTEFTYWPDGQWDQSRVVFAADVAEEEAEGE